MPLLISGSLISPTDERSYESLPNAFIYVGDDGLIKAIHQIAPTGDTPTTEEAFLTNVGHSGELEKLHLTKGEFLIPGFVDTHTVRPPFGYQIFSRTRTTARAPIPKPRSRSRVQTVGMA